MKHPFFLLPLLAAATACQALPPGAALPASEGPARARAANEVVVRFKPGTPAGDREALRQSQAPAAVDRVMPDAERWRFGDVAAARRAIAELAAAPGLKFAEANTARRLNLPTGGEAGQAPALGFSVLQAAAASDPLFGKQWNVVRAHFPDVWSKTRGKGVTVGVIDSGVDPDHPDLKAHLLPMIDEVVAMGNKDLLNDTDYAGRDGHGHGTHVCGIVGAIADNGIGVAGCAPEVTILPIKVTSATGDADDATISRGIVDAVDKGARVINLSIGGPDPSSVLLDALNYAFNKNVAVVIASGNDGQAVNYPAAYNGVISVGSTTIQDKVASYSSHGQNLVIAAPGGGTPGRAEGDPITSTTPTYDCYITLYEGKSKNYSSLSGTSMSAPHVTAAVALLLSQEPGLTPAQVRTRLAATADLGPGTSGFDPYYGFGILNVARAIAFSQDAGRRP